MLSPAQIQAVAANAGFTGPNLTTAVAVALAESFPSGNEQSYNPETNAPGGTPPGKGSYGLWQIYLRDHPEFASLNLYDPQTNAYAAYALWDAAGGFHPWATYNSGAYQAYLSKVPSASGILTNPVPLTLDAQTGLPVTTAAAIDASSMIPSPAPSWGTIILWGAVGLFALWVFEEAM
jgi:hypothetical protein